MADITGGGVLSAVTVRIGADLTQFAKGLQDSQKQLKSWGDSLQKTGSTLNRNLTIPLLAFGTAAVAASIQVDRAMDDIAIATGATGDKLQELQDIARKVGVSSASNIGVVGTIIGDLNTRLGLTGPALERLTRQADDAARMLRVAPLGLSSTFSQMVTNWRIAEGDFEATLDKMFKAAQATGVDIVALQSSLTDIGPVARQLGWDFNETTALLANFNRYGVDAASVAFGLRYAVQQLSQKGLDPAKHLDKWIEGIRRAATEQEAYALSAETFGTRGGVLMTDAIRNGVLNLNELKAALADSAGAIEKTTRATWSFDDSLQRFKNLALQSLEPFGNAITRVADDLLPRLSNGLKQAAEWFSSLPVGTQDAIVKIAGLVAVLGPAALLLSKIVGALSILVKFVAPLGKLVPVITNVGKAILHMPATIPLVAAAGAAGYEIAKVLHDNQNRIAGWFEGLKSSISKISMEARLAFANMLPDAVRDKLGMNIQAMKAEILALGDDAARTFKLANLNLEPTKALKQLSKIGSSLHIPTGELINMVQQALGGQRKAVEDMLKKAGVLQADLGKLKWDQAGKFIGSAQEFLNFLESFKPDLKLSQVVPKLEAPKLNLDPLNKIVDTVMFAVQDRTGKYLKELASMGITEQELSRVGLTFKGGAYTGKLNVGMYIVNQMNEVAQILANAGNLSGQALMNALSSAVKDDMTLLRAILDVFGVAYDTLFPQSDARRGPFSRLTASGRAIPATMAEGVLADRSLKEAVNRQFRWAGRNMYSSIVEPLDSMRKQAGSSLRALRDDADYYLWDAANRMAGASRYGMSAVSDEFGRGQGLKLTLAPELEITGMDEALRQVSLDIEDMIPQTLSETLPIELGYEWKIKRLSLSPEDVVRQALGTLEPLRLTQSVELHLVVAGQDELEQFSLDIEKMLPDGLHMPLPIDPEFDWSSVEKFSLELDNMLKGLPPLKLDGSISIDTSGLRPAINELEQFSLTADSALGDIGSLALGASQNVATAASDMTLSLNELGGAVTEFKVSFGTNMEETAGKAQSVTKRIREWFVKLGADMNTIDAAIGKQTQTNWETFLTQLNAVTGGKLDEIKGLFKQLGWDINTLGKELALEWPKYWELMSSRSLAIVGKLVTDIALGLIKGEIDWKTALQRAMNSLIGILIETALKVTQIGTIIQTVLQALWSLNPVLMLVAVGAAVAGLAAISAALKPPETPPDSGGQTNPKGLSESIPQFAKGGIVTRPTFAQIGEAGPEGIIPLTSGRARGLLGGGPVYNLTINVTGNTVRDDRDLDELVDRIAEKQTEILYRMGIRPDPAYV